MAVKYISHPADIISLDDIKAHCYIVGNDHDSLLLNYLRAACQRFTDSTQFVIGECEMEASFDFFTPIIRLHHSPITQLLSVKYFDKQGDEQTVEVTDIISDLDSRPARLVHKSGAWPNCDQRPGGIKIKFEAGHETEASLPPMIKWAILTTVAHMFEHREEVVDGTNMAYVPSTAQMVINMYEYKDQV